MRAVALVLLGFATRAYADDDPRDAFGFGKKPPPKSDTDCGDGIGFGCVYATDPLAETATIYSLTSWLPSSYLLRLPVGHATHDTVAHYAMGASRDDAGPSFAGATGLENRWLVNGAPADSVRTGAADTRLPLPFLDGIYVTTGGFTARDRASTGGIIDARLRSGTPEHEVDARVYAGITTTPRQRAIAPGSYYVRRGKLEAGPDAAASVVATGPLGDHAWYAGGLALDVISTKFTFTSSTIVDADGDMAPDGLPGVVVTRQFDEFTKTPVTWRAPFMLRAGLDRDVHHIDLTLIGTPATDASFLYNATAQAARVDGTTFVGDAIATWRGHWDNTRARAQFAWHRSMRTESAHDPQAKNMPQLLSAYVPTTIAEDQQFAGACEDDTAADPFPGIPNCPVPFGWFASGGAGKLTNVTADRPSITADVAHRIGANVVRAGATGEDARLVLESRFTGGSQIRSLFPTHMSIRRFADPTQPCHDDISLPCPTVEKSELRYRTRYTAAYVEDTWQADDRVAVDGGLRWELMWVGTELHYSDQLAPRLGASWDFLGKGRSRAWVSMGRSFALLPAGLGQTILARERYVDQVLSPFGEGRVVDTGATAPIADGIEAITQDELTAGAEVALERTIRARVWLQGRWLRRGLETVDGTFDNPGRTGGTPALRETGLVAAEVALAPKKQIIVRAGWMYGHTFGSWAGAFDPREGAILYAGSDYDAGSVNLFGRLPSDAGHRTYIEGERTGRLGSVKLAASARLTVGSGKPRNVLADSDDGFVYLLPRGSAGRAPMIAQANIRIGADIEGVLITLDLFNVFNRKEATSVDEVYASGAVQPIDGGTVADLPFLKNVDGTDATRRRTYATATAFQSPLSAVLGIQKTF